MRTILGVYFLLIQTAGACMQGPLDAYMSMPRGPAPVDVGPLRERLKIDPAERVEAYDEAYRPLIAAATGAEQQRLEMERSAICDILTGNSLGAIDTLLAIESAHPGLYGTASTLGTAYELAGDNRSALQWIREGIARNPESHGGTEWLHARILETKIAMESDPAYLAANPIVPYPERPEKGIGALLERNGQEKPNEDVMNALDFQLGERMLFVKPEDPIVADLLHSFARLEAARFSGAGEAGLMKLARQYGYRDGTERTLSGRAMGIIQSPRLPGAIVLSVVALVLLLKLRRW